MYIGQHHGKVWERMYITASMELLFLKFGVGITMMMTIKELFIMYRVECNITLFKNDYTYESIVTDFELLRKLIGIDMTDDVKEQLCWFRDDYYG